MLLDIASWLEKSGELEGLAELETMFELESSSGLDWGTESEGTTEVEDVAELNASIEVGERAGLGIETLLENNAELGNDTVPGYDDEGEALTELEIYEDVRDTPIPTPRIEDCPEAVLRTMLDWDTVGLL